MVASFGCNTLRPDPSQQVEADGVLPAPVEMPRVSASPGQPTTAATETRNWFQRKPKATPKMLVDFATFHAESGRLGEAEDALRKAIKQDPKYVDAYVCFGKIHMKQAQPNKAVEIIEEGLKKAPKSAELWNELAVVHASRGDFSAAVPAMQKAVDLNPTHKLHRKNFGGMLAYVGQYDRAVAEYSQAMPPAEAHFRVAGVLRSHGKHNECLQHLRQAVVSDPRHEEASGMLAHLQSAGPSGLGLAAAPTPKPRDTGVTPVAHFTPAAAPAINDGSAAPAAILAPSADLTPLPTNDVPMLQAPPTP